MEMEPPELEELPMHGRDPTSAYTDDPPRATTEYPESEHPTVEEYAEEHQSKTETAAEFDGQDATEVEEAEANEANEAEADEVEAQDSVEGENAQPDSQETDKPAAIPATDVPQRRYPLRENRTTWRDKVFHISVENALRHTDGKA